jgi:hypothetical protein
MHSKFKTDTEIAVLESSNLSMKWGFHYNQMRKQTVSNEVHVFVHGHLAAGLHMKLDPRQTGKQSWWLLITIEFRRE